MSLPSNVVSLFGSRAADTLLPVTAERREALAPPRPAGGLYPGTAGGQPMPDPARTIAQNQRAVTRIRGIRPVAERLGLYLGYGIGGIAALWAYSRLTSAAGTQSPTGAG